MRCHHVLWNGGKTLRHSCQLNGLLSYIVSNPVIRPMQEADKERIHAFLNDSFARDNGARDGDDADGDDAGGDEGQGSPSVPGPSDDAADDEATARHATFQEFLEWTQAGCASTKARSCK